MKSNSKTSGSNRKSLSDKGAGEQFDLVKGSRGKIDRNSWEYVAGKKLTQADHGKLGALKANPERAVNPDTGAWKSGSVDDLKSIANKALGIYRGRNADGNLREATPHEERVVSDEFLDHISCDPKALAAQSRHRPHRSKALRLAQTGGVNSEEKLTKQQQRWLAALQGDDPEARAKAEAEVRAWMLEKHQAEQEDIDASLAEMGYGEDSVPRARLEWDPEWDELEDDDPELDYLSIDLEDCQ